MELLFSASDDPDLRRDLWLLSEPTAPFSVVAEAMAEPGEGSVQAGGGSLQAGGGSLQAGGGSLQAGGGSLQAGEGSVQAGGGSLLPRAWWDGDRLLELDRPVGEQVFNGSHLTHSPPPPHDSLSVGRLLAVAGPHAGCSWPLGPGTHLIGRSDDAAVNLVRDPTVSRRHATLTVTGSGSASIADEGSVHGTLIEGGASDSSRALDPEAHVRLGASVLVWRPGQPGSSRVVPNGEGGKVFNRPPRLLTPPTSAAVRFPGPPPVRSGVNFPLLSTLAPLALGVLLALVLHQVLYLLFTLLAPVIGVSNWWSSRRSGARSHRQDLAAHHEAHRRAEEELRLGLADETARRRREYPDPATLAEIAAGPQPELWERRPGDADHMKLRLGLADLAPDLAVEGLPFAEAAADGALDLLLDLVPAVVDLPADGVLGIAGPRRSCEAVARALLVQAAVLHAPDDLVVTVLTGPHQEEAWGWARWLPHTRDGDGRPAVRIAATDASVSRLAAELSAMVDDRLALGSTAFPVGRPGGGAPWEGPTHLVVVDGAYQLGSLPAVTKILRRGPQAGVLSVCIDDSERLLPEECHAVAVLDPSTPAQLTLSTGRGRTKTEVLADQVDAATAETVARHLCPLRLNRRVVAGAVIPSSVRLLAELGLDHPDPADLAQRWGRSTEAVIGVGEAGPLVVDLAKDGPHGLVAGTTGSGKSELLQTLIASLAVANRPDAMSFVLVDYKGGSAFKECARLPHTVGLVTDLDGHLTERALASIGAELRRREVILADAGAKDIEAYWRVAGPGDTVLGRLVIVIDEFASLVEELPSFVDGLVDLARRGRSLGIHLILATQRPSGVVSAAIKTNTNLRIAMRVTDAADSVDVIDSAAASRITKGLPGRGYVRVGHDDLTEFQAARIGGRRPGASAAAAVVPVGWATLADPVVAGRSEPGSDEDTDLSVLVDALNEAARVAAIPTPASPWLPALGEQVVAEAGWLRRPEAPGPHAALFGVEDMPAVQTQRPAAFDPARDGHLLTLGDPGSGRSTFLRAVAAGLAARNSVADVHMYGIDCGNGALVPLSAFPHCGAVVTRREPDRVERLLVKLSHLVTQRQQLLARGGFATIADQRSHSSAAEKMPYVVVLLDRWEGFNAEFENLDGGQLVTTVMHLMREGPGVGLRFVVTADRSGTSPRFSSLADRILALRLNDRNAYSVLGLNPRHLPDTIPPGRAFPVQGGTEIQIALLADDPSGPAQVEAIETLAATARAEAAGVPEALRPDPIAVLPVLVPLDGLLDGSDGLLVGVGGDRLEALHVSPLQGPGFVISGPARSGRSNALVVMAQSAVAAGGRVVAVTARPSPLRALAGRPGIDAVLDATAPPRSDLESLLAVPLCTVVVDDAELVADTAMSDLLTGFLRTARDRQSMLVLAGTSGELGQFRGFIPEARKSRTGLLLSPGPTDGDVLGVRLPRTSLFSGTPGRGVLIVNGEMTTVQVPFDEIVT